jgi:hypothetical protein
LLTLVRPFKEEKSKRVGFRKHAVKGWNEENR